MYMTVILGFKCECSDADRVYIASKYSASIVLNSTFVVFLRRNSLAGRGLPSVLCTVLCSTMARA